MNIGYARVSTKEQNLDRQIDLLTENHCEKIFEEKVSGKDKERPELEKLLEFVRPGDTLIVTELTRLSRSQKDLTHLVDKLDKLEINLKSLKEVWVDTTTAHGKLVFTIFTGLVEFERDLMRERIIDGVKAARKRGIKGGRKPVDADAINTALKLYDSMEYTLPQIAKMTKISIPTIYRYQRVRKMKEENQAS